MNRAILKIKYSRDFEAYDYHQRPFNYYILYLVYSKDDNEILKKYIFYEDQQIESIINKNQGIIFYKYYENNKVIYYISIKIDDQVYNFKIQNHDRWKYNFVIE